MSRKCPDYVQKTLSFISFEMDCQNSGHILDKFKFLTKPERQKRSRFGTFPGHKVVRNLSIYLRWTISGQFPDIYFL